MAMVARALAGLALWAGGFTLLYALHGTLCGRGAAWVGGPARQTILVGAWLILVGLAGGWALVATRAGVATFWARLALAGAWSGLVGLVFTGAPVLLQAHCQ
jgi:hypothetical protein